MDIGIRVKFDFQIPFTTTDIEVLMELSASHYDGKCQAASEIGGFIYGTMPRNLASRSTANAP